MLEVDSKFSPTMLDPWSSGRTYFMFIAHGTWWAAVPNKVIHCSPSCLRAVVSRLLVPVASFFVSVWQGHSSLQALLTLGVLGATRSAV